MVRFALRASAILGLTVVSWVAAVAPARSVSIDEAGEMKLGVRAYTAARIGTQDTDRTDTINPLTGTQDYVTFPFSAAGHLRQNRFYVEAEWDHNIRRLMKEGMGPMSLLDALPFDISTLKYHLVYRFEGEGIYDYGPREFRTHDQYVFDQIDPCFPTLCPGLTIPRGSLTRFGNDNFVPFIRKRLRELATIRNRLFQAFVDVQVEDLFIRVGRQILSWGETDNFRLLDNINPLDNSFGGFLISLDERRVPLDMLRANYYFGNVGPLNELFVEGYWAFDNAWGGYPGIPQGSPWQLPNLGEPSVEVRGTAFKPANNVRNSRGGGQFKFNAPIPILGEATFGFAHYYTYFDTPTLQNRTVKTALGPILIPGPFNFEPDNPLIIFNGVRVEALQRPARVQVTGASSTFVIPASISRHMFLSGEPVIRTELAYFKREPRFNQTQIDPFYILQNTDCQKVPVASAADYAPGGSVNGSVCQNPIRKGDSWNFVLGIDINQFVRWINPNQSVFFSTQFFYKHLRHAVQRRVVTTPAATAITSPDFTTIEGEVLPVPEFSAGSAQPSFIHTPIDQYLQTLFVSTAYMSGQLIPSMTLFYDWFGSFVFIPSLTYSRDPFRFTVSYNFLTAQRLKGASGTSLLRDRDNVLFQLDYVL